MRDGRDKDWPPRRSGLRSARVWGTRPGRGRVSEGTRPAAEQTGAAEEARPQRTGPRAGAAGQVRGGVCSVGGFRGLVQADWLAGWRGLADLGEGSAGRRARGLVRRLACGLVWPGGFGEESAWPARPAS
ncbi:hypothetical protein ACFPN7_40965 [Amycolatopsis halotolerans]|uniref:hypothetical protein n=1 Tax=Amycolatopsis halotolerans TaxID=330083 RepID=UPI00360A6C6C